MLKIGLTGGIGSGKSTVCRLFELIGINVYFSDVAAKTIMQENEKIIYSIKKLFGENVYKKENILDNVELGEIVFNDKTALNKLNSLVHPFVMEDFYQWCRQKENNNYIILESAILFETGIYKELDKTICISSPLEIRINRIAGRDKISREMVIKRIENQSSDNDKMQLSDFVIINDEKNSLIGQVNLLHREILSN